MKPRVLITLLSVLFYSIGLSQPSQFYSISKEESNNRSSFQRFGKSVTKNKDFIAVSSSKGKGEVVIYSSQNNEFSTVQTITAPSTGNYNDFGSYVEMNDEFLIIASNLNYFNNGGIIRIYQLQNGQFEFLQEITKNERDFGRSADFSGRTLVVGSPLDNYDSNNNNFISDAGSVYVFSMNNGVWNFVQKETAINRIQSSCFGNKVQVVGNNIYVGAKLHSKQVFQLTFNPSKTKWYRHSFIEYEFANSQMKFGSTFDFEGDEFVIGAPEDDLDKFENDFISSAGSVYTGNINDVSMPIISKINDLHLCAGTDVFVYDFNIFNAEYTDLTFNITSSNKDVLKPIDIEVRPDLMLQIENKNFRQGSSEIQIRATNSNGESSSIQFSVFKNFTDYNTLNDVEICLGDSALIFGEFQTDEGFYFDTLINDVGCPFYNVIELVHKYNIDTSITLVGPNTAVVQSRNETYTWYNCDTKQPAQGINNREIYTALFSGNYQVEISNQECTVRSNCVYLTNNVVSVNEIDQELYFVMDYTHKQINVKTTLNRNRSYTYEINNMAGQKIFSGKLKANFKIDLDVIKSGSYVLKMLDDLQQKYSYVFVMP